MKRVKLFLLTLFVVVNVSLQAQFRAGAKAGVNLSDIYFEISSLVVDIYKPRAGFHGGLFAEYMFNERFGLQSELSYYSIGADINQYEYYSLMVEAPSATLKAHVSMSAMQWPVYMKVKTPLSDNTMLYGMAGAFVSYSFNATQDMKVSEAGESANFRFDLLAPEIHLLGERMESPLRQRKTNAGLALEVGVEINRQMTIGVGYRQVLNNMTGYTSDMQLRPFDVKMNTWIASFTLGYYL